MYSRTAELRGRLASIGIGLGKTFDFKQLSLEHKAAVLLAMKEGEDKIQKDSPGADKESNWLPAPGGPMYLVMRLYWPKTEPPSILPVGKGT